MQKHEELEKGAAKLRGNIEQMEQFCKEFSELIKVCINYLDEYKTWWLQQMQTEKEALSALIEAAVHETNNCLDQGLIPTNPLALALWNSPSDELQVVSCSIRFPDLPNLCQTWVSYQNTVDILCDFYEPRVAIRKFASVWKNTVTIYDVESKELEQATLAVDLGEGGSYVALDRENLLCVGAEPPSAAVYALHLSSLDLTGLSPLCTPRAGAGVARARGFVYVFGGWNGLKGLNSCEKYDLHMDQWFPLSNMQYNRSMFTPCVFGNLIYLPCPYTTSVIETFSLTAETFKTLPVSLPNELKFGSVAFVTGGELCILTGYKQVARWKIGSESEFSIATTNKKCASTQQPLKLNSLVLIANCCNGKLEKFSLKSYSFL